MRGCRGVGGEDILECMKGCNCICRATPLNDNFPETLRMLAHRELPAFPTQHLLSLHNTYSPPTG